MKTIKLFVLKKIAVPVLDWLWLRVFKLSQSLDRVCDKACDAAYDIEHGEYDAAYDIEHGE